MLGTESAEEKGWLVVYLSTVRFSRCVAAAIAFFASTIAFGQPLNGSAHGGLNERPPVYQRRALDGAHHGRMHGAGHSTYWRSPPVAAGWFQRPYPYHLDYYRMRYGGSYAPYFGNLYGPPQVVTAPPYYGPYVGGAAYPFGLTDGSIVAPFAASPLTVPTEHPPAYEVPPANQPAEQSESLPTPAP